MQFHLEPDELKLLAELLLEQDPDQCKDILDKIMARDLRFDAGELEQTADLLAGTKRTLNDQIALQTNPALKTELQQRLALLERGQERVNEACVMF